MGREPMSMMPMGFIKAGIHNRVRATYALAELYNPRYMNTYKEYVEQKDMLTLYLGIPIYLWAIGLSCLSGIILKLVL